ncbi:MAG: LysM peptidoglycan-binding domain-containing protein [Bacteroidota bacterium]
MKKLVFIWCILGLSPVLAQDFIEGLSYDYIPDASYDLVEDRISCIDSDVPLNYNERVKAFIDYFTVRDRAYTRKIMRRVDFYFPIFEEYLAKYDLPKDLKYLSIIESGLVPNAISPARAVGLWQFVSYTGKMYGLDNDWYLDERMDPYEATDAACRHLRDLHRMFGDWELALAAYNCGPGNVRKAIRRSGYKKTFWEIYRYLPRETRSYVPQFVAMIYTLNYAPEHNLFVEETEYEVQPVTDTLQISQYFHLETFCNQLGLCLDDMLKLNPQIKRGALPEGTKNFALKIPYEMKEEIDLNRAFLLDTASKVGKEELVYLSRNMPGSTYGREKVVYRVSSGDVLGTIAQRHHVRVSDIREWNNLNSNLIRVGQRLNIWVLPTYNSSTKDLYLNSANTTAVAKVTPKPQTLEPGQKFYMVQNGDTLWDIANLYANLSIDKIKQLNNLTSNVIKPGMKLIISE